MAIRVACVELRCNGDFDLKPITFGLLPSMLPPSDVAPRRVYVGCNAWGSFGWKVPASCFSSHCFALLGQCGRTSDECSAGCPSISPSRFPLGGRLECDDGVSSSSPSCDCLHRVFAGGSDLLFLAGRLFRECLTSLVTLSGVALSHPLATRVSLGCS